MIKNAIQADDGLHVKFVNSTTDIIFPWHWLKDHGVDETSLDPTTLQRRVNTFEIEPDIKPLVVEFESARQIVQIKWADEAETVIPADLLMQVTGRMPRADKLLPNQQRVLWKFPDNLTDLPSVAYQAVMESEDGLFAWLSNIQVYGFSLVQDVPSTQSATEALARRVGNIEETIFGGLWMLSAELNEHDDSAYSNSYLEPHTDATYYRDAAGLQMFNCFQFDGEGGESILVDSFAIAEQIKQDDPQAYQTLTEVIVPGRYMEPGVHLFAERAPFRLNNDGELEQVSFNNYDRAPFILPDVEMQRFYHAYGLFHEHAIDERNWLKIPLRPGMTLIFDNWRTMHGRMAYHGKRVFCGCYHNRTEFESKLRVLQAQRQ
ncbi:MAG: hypothetical protein HKN85_05410 [Gammaproteobacteria bacterium]|nr:hypothetical protein [Gammaproteobacteria bacterium]